jgi:phosphoglycerate dehydrogenase-like enzyme
LHGRTATILGYGRIGQRVGRVCHALDMHVIGIRRHAAEPDPERILDDYVELHPPADLRELLPRTDVLVVSVPLTQETEGLIGAAELAQLPREAVIVNVGRGRVIDEAALYHALRDRTILAAGLDVWYHYPMRDEDRGHTAPSRYPFHELNNVVMSPHRGGWITAAEESRVTELASLLRAAAEGRPIPSAVDKVLGY